MNDLAPRRRDAVAASSHVPQPSPWLERAIRDLAHPTEGLSPDQILSDLPEPVRVEARTILPRHRATIAAATAADWDRFLKPFGVLTNAPPRERWKDAVGAIAFALDDVPASLLTTERQKEGMRRFTFWPRPAELSQWLGPEIVRLKHQVRSLERIAAAPPTVERVEPTEAEKAAVRDKAAAIVAELRAGQSSAPKPPVTARHLTPEQLAEARRQAGIHIPGRVTA